MIRSVCQFLTVALGGIIGLELALLIIITTMPTHQITIELREAVHEWCSLDTE